MVGGSALSPLLAALEDGGELLVMSVICWFVFQLLEEERRPSTPPQWPEVRLVGVKARSRLARTAVES